MSAFTDKILDTATNLFQTCGINSTGVDKIVAVAGTTKMTLYKRFQTKEELILKVLERSQYEFQTWLDDKLKANAKTPADEIHLLFGFLEEWLTSPSFLGIGYIKASAEFPNEESAIHQLCAKQSLEFRKYIGTVVSEANIKDADSLAFQLSLIFEGAVQAEQMKRGSGAIKHAKRAAKTLIEASVSNTAAT